MLKIGITGGMGSGKSTVCQIFETLGIPVFSSDQEAKWLMTHQPTIKVAILSLFGPNAYNEAQELNRAHIAKMAFEQADLTQKLNQLVHPAVQSHFKQWCTKQNSPYVIKEAALLFESGSYLDLDYVVVVSAPKWLRVQRAMNRDGATKEQIEKRLKHQLSEKQRLERADFIIKNDGNKLLIPQVLKLHQQFIFASLG